MSTTSDLIERFREVVDECLANSYMVNEGALEAICDEVIAALADPAPVTNEQDEAVRREERARAAAIAEHAAFPWGSVVAARILGQGT